VRGGLRVALLALLVVGCGAPLPMSDAGPGDAGPLTFELGEGQSTFRAIAEGDTLLLARGCQGLQHVWITLRATGIDPRGVHVQLRLTRASDGVEVASELSIRLSFTEQGGFVELSSLQLVVPDPSVALDQDLVLEGEIVDRDGRSASVTHVVRIAWGTEVCG
jgi:hypothetical protein